MAVQKKRSARSGSRAAGAQNDGANIGWGLGAESGDEDLFMRRVLFAVVVAVLGCMGAWFMVTTVSVGNGPTSRLTIGVPAAAHTVSLLTFPDDPDSRAIATEVAGKPEMLRLAGSNEFSLVALPDGKCALCVGRFDDESSPELARVLREFSQYTDGVTHPFAEAAVMPIAR